MIDLVNDVDSAVCLLYALLFEKGRADPHKESACLV